MASSREIFENKIKEFNLSYRYCSRSDFSMWEVIAIKQKPKVVVLKNMKNNKKRYIKIESLESEFLPVIKR